MTKERPILFSGPMVRAILSGAKSVTRRIVKPQPILCEYACGHSLNGQMIEGNPAVLVQCPYGVPGDRLWVRETWAHYQTVNHILHSGGRAFDEVSDGLAGYRADGHDTIEDFRDHIRMMNGYDLEKVIINGDRWRPSIHMPRWASRITLEITGVRVERLQEITEEDARAEGVELGLIRTGLAYVPSMRTHSDERYFDHARLLRGYRGAFAALWDRINGKRASWESNPFVWAIEFNRVEESNG